MTEPVAYLSGRMVPRGEAVLPVHDAGIVSGATVTDFCRTFGGRLYRWADHLARFRRDCATCFIPVRETDDELTRIAERLVAANAASGEVALITFATPGPLGVYAGQPGVDGPPTLVMHTLPLAVGRYRRFFAEGVALAVAGSHAAGEDDLAPPPVKHRSRLHWWRADQVVRARADVPAGAVALLDDGRHLTETAIGHLLVVRDGGVLTPPRGTVLDGVSLCVVAELCHRLGVPFREDPLTLADAQAADEAMLCGTAFCLAGVRWLEGGTLPWPGPVFTRLLAAWSDDVGTDIAAQFRG